MNIYPFIMAGWLKRLVNDILGVLHWAQDVEEGHAHVFDLMESAQETGYFASQCGWEVEWVLRPRSASADGDIVPCIARLVSDYEGARYVAVAYSKNTNSYYAFAYPSEHVYHFTRADIVYYHFSRDEDYMLSILKEESALSQGEEGSFEAIHEREFTLSLTEEEVEEVVEKEEDREWAIWLSVELRYVTRQRPPVNCAYVVAEFSNPVVEHKAWRRVDLSSLCIEKDEDECYESLARQFLKP